MDEFMLKYPGALISTLKTTHHIWGKFYLQNQWYELKVRLPKFPYLYGMHLSIRQGRGFTKIFTSETLPANVDPNWTVQQLIDFVPALCHRDAHPQIVDSIMRHDIYEQFVSVFSPDCYELHANAVGSVVRFTQFAGHEHHYLEVNLPTLVVRKHSLPVCKVPFVHLLEECITLKAMVELFQKYLEDLQPFYDNLNVIDELCYVVQPSPLTLNHNWRMFKYSDRVFFKLTIDDPLAPVASMSLQIIGPTLETEKLRSTYSEGLKGWDPELDILKNLLRICNVCYFPMPPANDEERTAHEEPCNICLEYRLEQGFVPVTTCDNAKCRLMFHPNCLYKWFNTQTHTKEFCKVSFGQCPFCKSKVSMPFDELLTYI